MKNLGQAHANLDQQAYHIIKRMIGNRELLPGNKIPQERLARELGISRTPLVNALKYIEKEKLIEARPRRGFFVRQFSRDEMISIFELREVLEGLAARHAATDASEENIATLRRFFSRYQTRSPIRDYRRYRDEDRRFHGYVAGIGAREFLQSILQTYNIISFSYQFISSEGLVRPPDETVGEHLAIIEAIVDHNPDVAEALMRRHFQKSIEALGQTSRSTDTGKIHTAREKQQQR